MSQVQLLDFNFSPKYDGGDIMLRGSGEIIKVSSISICQIIRLGIINLDDVKG